MANDCNKIWHTRLEEMNCKSIYVPKNLTAHYLVKTRSFSSLQQSDAVRNKATAEKIYEAQIRFHFLHRRKGLYCCSNMNTKTIKYTLLSRPERVTSAVFCSHTLRSASL